MGKENQVVKKDINSFPSFSLILLLLVVGLLYHHHHLHLGIYGKRYGIQLLYKNLYLFIYSFYKINYNNKGHLYP